MLHRTVFLTLADQPIYRKETNEKNEQPNGYSFSLAPPTGLEPVTSWLTVMRSTDWAMEEYKCWHLPIFTGRHQPTIVGTTGLNFCVRYGNRWTPGVIDTNLLILFEDVTS